MLKPAYLVLVLSAAWASRALPSGSSCSGSPSGPTLPQIEGASNLPQPPAGSHLLHIALGFGLQNYTCASRGATPSSQGALAMLYDITTLYPGGRGADALSPADWAGLPARALWSHPVPLNLDYTYSPDRVDPGSPGASTTRPFPPDSPLSVWGTRPLPFLGHHLFNADGVPEFVLAGVSPPLLCDKLAAVDAPRAADRGPQGTGAVPWLQLRARHPLVKYVYRVSTSGGASRGCANAAGQDSTPYAAMYWFFG